MKRKTRFPIGLEFIYYADKSKLPRRIIDILTTTNSSGEVVKVEYLVQHQFLGQNVSETMVDVAIARSLEPEVFALYNK